MSITILMQISELTFYIQTEEGNDSGKISFKSPNEILGICSLRYNENNKLNMSVVKYKPYKID